MTKAAERLHVIIALRRVWPELRELLDFEAVESLTNRDIVRELREWWQRATVAERLMAAELAAEQLGIELDLDAIKEPGSDS